MTTTIDKMVLVSVSQGLSEMTWTLRESIKVRSDLTDREKKHAKVLAEIVRLEEQHASALESLDFKEIFSPLKESITDILKVIKWVRGVFSKEKEPKSSTEASGKSVTEKNTVISPRFTHLSLDFSSQESVLDGLGMSSRVLKSSKSVKMSQIESLDVASSTGQTAPKMSRLLGGLQGIFQKVGQAVGKLLSNLGRTVSSAFSKIASALKTPQGLAVAAVAVAALTYSIGFLSGAIVGALPSLASFGKSWLLMKGFDAARPFMEAAQAFEPTRRTFFGAMGGTKEGDMMLEWVQDYRESSVINAKRLQEASLTLRKANVSPLAHLKTAEMLAYKSGKAPEDSINEAAALVADIRNGNRERLDELKEYGLDPAKYEKFSPAEALAAINSDLSNDSQVMDLMSSAGSGINQLEQGMASFQRGMEKIGLILADVFGPIIKEAGEYLVRLADNGAFQKILDSFKELFGITEGENPLIQAINIALGVIKVVTHLLLYIKDGITSIYDKIQGLTKNLKPQNAIASMGPAPAFIVKSFELAFKHGLPFGKHIMSTLELIGSLSAAGVSEDRADRDAELERILQAIESPEKSWGAEGQSFWSRLVNMYLSYKMREMSHLASIEKHTEQLVEASRIMAGGGELGRLGISAMEASKMSYGERSRPGPRARSIAGMLEEAVTQIMHEALGQERRQQGTRYA